MEISDLLVSSGKSVIDHEMDPRRVPDLRRTHIAEHLDRERPGTILSHCQVCRKDGDVAGTMDLFGAFRSNANDLLGKGERIIIQYALAQGTVGGGKTQPLLNVDRGS